MKEFNVVWNKDKYQELITYLSSLQDLKYKEFHSKNIKSDNLIGVRTPVLKKIAKEISKGDYLSFIENNTSNLYELKMIEGFLYGYLKIDIHDLLELLNNFLNKLDNWCLVDLTISNLKAFNKEQEVIFKYAKKLIHDKNNYIKRFGLIIFLNYCLHDIFVDKILEIVSKIKTTDYYVKMAISWLMSVSYIKYKEKTLIYLVNMKDDFIYHKTLSKICDSNRINKKEKDFIKELKLNRVSK